MAGAPSTSPDEILARQSLVNLFLTRSALRADLVELLKGAEDAMRISQKFLLGKGGVEDLISVRNTIGTWKSIHNRVLFEKECEKCESGGILSPDDWRSLDQLMQRMVDLSDLAGRIDSAIDAGEIGNEESEREEGDEKMLDTHGAIPSEAPKLPSLPGVDMKWTIKPQLRTSTT